MPTSKPMRYSHSDGQTEVCYDSSGRYILTCGSDGDVRIWEDIEDDDAISHRVGDKAFAIAYKKDRFFVATDTNTIQAYTFPDGSPDGIITRFTAPANHITLSSNEPILVAGGSDFTIRVVHEGNNSHKTIQGHEAPVLGLALDPTDTFLASSSCDGTVRVWKMSDRSQVQSWSLIPKCNDVSLSKTMCRMCWEPMKGELLYVPVEKEIHVYKRESWEKVTSLSSPVIQEHISVLSISPDGQYIAAGSSDGWICIFNVKSKKCIDKHRNERGLSITCLAWNPKDNMELAFCDNQGQLGLLKDFSKSESNKVSGSSAENQVPKGVFDDDDDDFLIQATNDEPGDQEPNSDDDVPTQSKHSRPLLSEDEDSLSGVLKATSEMDDDVSSVVSDKPVLAPPEIRYEGYRPTALQLPFQPGSTPQHLSSRFMVWNLVGLVKQYNTDEENSIDIEFHDASVHHAMHITNNLNYVMADISMEAVLLASEKDEDTGSKLTCMHFAAWDSNKEWSTTLPNDEEIEAIALGEGWAAVATDARNVRIFTIAGVQKEIFSIAGPVVSMSGHSGQLVIIYHRGMAIPGDQCMGVMVIDVKLWKREIRDEPLPLSVKSTLSWLGFSAEGTPFYMDSAGIVRMLNRSSGRTWVEVANTKLHAKGKSDHYWVVGVSENPQQLRCIPCKGSRFPPTLPRPVVTVLPFQIPVCEPSLEKSQYEELLWRTRLLTGHFDHWDRQGYEVDEMRKAEAQKPVQEALMKLFALSARSEREYRSLEVCEMMPEQHTLQLAIKYSSRLRFINLAQKISELASRREEEDQANMGQQAGYEEEEEEEEVVPQGRRTFSFAREVNQSEEVEDRSEVSAIEEDQDVDMEEEEEDSGPSGPMLALKQKEVKTNKTPSTTGLRANPFKVASQSAPSRTGMAKGSQVFDGLTKKKLAEKPVPFQPDTRLTKISKTTQKKISQPKLFSEKKAVAAKESKEEKTKTSSTPNQKNPTAFDLWLEENKSNLEEKMSGSQEEDFNKYATEQFRTLSKEDRQEWLKKAKSLTQSGNKSKENTAGSDVDSDTANSKKRKWDDESADNTLNEASKKLKDNDTSAEQLQKKKPLSQSTNAKLANFAFHKD